MRIALDKLKALRSQQGNLTVRNLVKEALAAVVGTTFHHFSYSLGMLGRDGDAEWHDKVPAHLLPTSELEHAQLFVGEEASFVIATDPATAVTWTYVFGGGRNSRFLTHTKDSSRPVTDAQARLVAIAWLDSLIGHQQIMASMERTTEKGPYVPFSGSPND